MDKLSRVFSIGHKWQIQNTVLQGIFKKWGYPQIDFSGLSIQGRPGSGFFGICMSYFMDKDTTPPSYCTFVSQNSEKDKEKALVVLIALLWFRQIWFPDLIHLLVCPLIHMPLIPNLLIPNKGNTSSKMDIPAINSLATGWLTRLGEQC